MMMCNRCVMDASAINFEITKTGCNYCDEFERQKKIASSQNNLEQLVERIKRDGRTKEYDCVVGVSGGIDSSWVLVKAVELGLRPLAVHMDNTWNSEIASSNIRNLVEKLNIDLETYVIDWGEYKVMLQALLDSDVVDVELLYDNALYGVNYKFSSKYGIKHLLGGLNYATEGIPVPENWNWNKYDSTNIKSILRARKVKRLKSTYPYFSIEKFIYHKFFRKTEWHSILDLINYKKEDALVVLEKQYDYKRYPYKHYESILTRFYQGYLLPSKFGIDKRKLHLSTLIMNNELNRDDALTLLTESAYPSERDLVKDKLFFLNKMGWSEEDLSSYIKRPRQNHENYNSSNGRIKIYSGIRKLIK